MDDIGCQKADILEMKDPMLFLNHLLLQEISIGIMEVILIIFQVIAINIGLTIILKHWKTIIHLK